MRFQGRIVREHKVRLDTFAPKKIIMSSQILDQLDAPLAHPLLG